MLCHDEAWGLIVRVNVIGQWQPPSSRSHMHMPVDSTLCGEDHSPMDTAGSEMPGIIGCLLNSKLQRRCTSHSRTARMASQRSRRGCEECRRRRRKCDEERPMCGPCASFSRTCQYKLQVVWASRQNLEIRSNPRARKAPVNRTPTDGNLSHMVTMYRSQANV